MHFSLSGENYTTNAAFSLVDIGDSENTLLYCVTSFTKCCRHNETGTNHSSGSWKFPNGSVVPSRVSRNASIVRTRGLSSVILHQLTNESSPTGVYTCEIPDGAGNTTKLFAYIFYIINPGTKLYHIKCPTH